ncbi:MAG: DNA repair protein RecO [Acidobacteria bacterium]|nr:DNA repair protein RecO [Acidobacteriota bacterium]
MPLYTTEAVILRTYKLGEADRIVVFLTKDRGKKRGVAHGARRPRSRFGGALEPLTKVAVAYFEKERRELVSLNYAEAERSPLAATDPRALGYVAYFAELLDEWAPDGDPNEKLYRLGASTVEACAAGVPIDGLARYFEFWVLRLQGVFPSPVACQRCGGALDGRERGGAFLGAGEAVLTCLPCAQAGGRAPEEWEADLSGDAIAFLKGATTVSPLRVGELPFSARIDRELEAVHRRLMVTHLEKELKSTRVLREMRR